MKRTGEKVLSIISIVMNVVSLVLLIFVLMGTTMMSNDPSFQNELESSMYGSGLTEAEIMMGVDYMEGTMGFITSIGWIFIALGVISIILTIVGVVKVNNNPKLAGILFIVACVLSGVLSLPGILLIIAAIMCFVRKPKIQNVSETPVRQTDENGYYID